MAGRKLASFTFSTIAVLLVACSGQGTAPAISASAEAGLAATVVAQSTEIAELKQTVVSARTTPAGGTDSTVSVTSDVPSPTSLPEGSFSLDNLVSGDRVFAGHLLSASISDPGSGGEGYKRAAILGYLQSTTADVTPLKLARPSDALQADAVDARGFTYSCTVWQWEGELPGRTQTFVPPGLGFVFTVECRVPNGFSDASLRLATQAGKAELLRAPLPSTGRRTYAQAPTIRKSPLNLSAVGDTVQVGDFASLKLVSARLEAGEWRIQLQVRNLYGYEITGWCPTCTDDRGNSNQASARMDFEVISDWGIAKGDSPTAPYLSVSVSNLPHIPPGLEKLWEFRIAAAPVCIDHAECDTHTQFSVPKGLPTPDRPQVLAITYFLPSGDVTTKLKKPSIMFRLN
jgi:hypothetical protein